MESVVMKQLSIAFTVWWLSVMSGNAVGHVLPNNSDVQLKSDGNILELYKSSGNGSSWLQMVLVFARHSSNSQPQLHIEDAQRKGNTQALFSSSKGSKSDEVTTKCPEMSIKCPEVITKCPEVTTKCPEVTTKSTETPIGCKQGFVQLESKKCYFFSNKTETWQNALKSCQAMETTLVYPMNEKENTVLVSYLKNFEGVNSWWFGATDLAKEGQWVWVHSEYPIGYANWSPGEPNGGKSSNCLHIYKAFGWKWNDVPCNKPYNYICQQ